MAVQTRVRRIARNPARKARKRLTPKQIKYFGSARQRAALKSNRKRKRRVVAKANTHRKRTAPRVRTRTRVITKIKYRTRKVKAATTRKRRTRRRNPVPVVFTLGATNPRKRSVSMARRKRKNSGHKHHAVRARSRNPKRVYRSRRRNTSRRVVRHRRNPMSLFGGSGAKHTVEIVGGVLVGMAGTKFVPTLIPASISSMGGTTIGPVLWSGVSAFVLKKVAEMVKKGAFADAVFLGGLAQTGSVLLNALVPSIWGSYGISGMGALVPGRFPVPQNPITAGQYGTTTSIGASNARIGVSGLGRAFGGAF